MKKNQYKRKSIKEDLSQKYCNEVCSSCESMTYGKRKFTLPQKYRLSAYFYQNSKYKQLVGPVADASAEGYDAVLLNGDVSISRSNRKDGNCKRFADFLIKMKDGTIEERWLYVDLSLYRNYPGNHLVIIESKTGIGIYEDTTKNEKDPIYQEYEKKLEKVEICNLNHQLAQIFLLFVVCIIVAFAYFCIRYQPWYIKLPVCIITSLLYPKMLKVMKKHYIKKFGKEIFKNIFMEIGIFYYSVILIVIVLSAFGRV